jgi:hypothetical protein
VPGARGHETDVVLRHVGHRDDIGLSVEGRGKAAPAEACRKDKGPVIDVVVRIGDTLAVGGDQGVGGVADSSQGSVVRAQVRVAVRLGHAAANRGEGRRRR